MAGDLTSHRSVERTIELAVLAGAIVVAILGTRSYAGAWNDGSRLATIECLVDYHTLAIDRSIFLNAPVDPDSASGYSQNDPLLAGLVTQDKLLIDGHYYSDKGPAPAVLLAGLYQALQWRTGLRAADQPARFCYWMNLASSGLAYVLTVWGLFRLAGQIGLPLALRLLLTASLAFSTVTLAYERHVNNHIALLAVAMLLLCVLVRFAKNPAGETGWTGPLLMGSLAGLGYTLDLATGPVLLLCTLGLVAYRCRRVGPILILLLGALPWLGLHHTLNYLVGGTFKPANAVPDYLEWPGSPFGPENMTGVWNHGSPEHFVIYALALLFGKRGFVGHNLPLFVLVPALPFLLRRRLAERPEVLFACAFCGGTWLAYAITSTNYSGACCSIRWFVPFLAPGYFLLGLALRERQGYRVPFAILSAWGAVLALLMWQRGPWLGHMVPFFWPVQAAALLSVAAVVFVRKRPTPGAQLRDQTRAA